MTQSIPSGFSMDDLQNMLENAQPEPSSQPKEMGEATREEIENLTDRLLSQALAEINDPMVHKTMMVNILNNFIRWHCMMAERAIETEQNTETIACWFKDAGKFQAIANILFTISCGDDDFYLRK